jgi:VWFA-related protein
MEVALRSVFSWGAVPAFVMVIGLISPPVVLGADQEEMEQVGGLPYSDSYDKTTVGIDVFVRDGAGDPVTGLKRERFHLFQDGVEAPISHFAAFTERSFNRNLPGAGEGAQSGGPDADIAGINDAAPVYIILFIDNLNLRYADRNRVLRSMRSFIDGIMTGPVQVMVVSHLNGIDVVQPFTDNPREVVNSLRLLRMSEAALDQRDEDHQRIQREVRRAERNNTRSKNGRDRTMSDLYTKIRTFATEEDFVLEKTLGAIRSSGTALVGVEGRKSLIYVSNGLPMVLASDLLHEFSGMGGVSRAALTIPYNRRRRYDALAAAANAQEISIYTIDATGTHIPNPPTGNFETALSSSALAIAAENQRMPLRILAEQTGGISVVKTDDFGVGLDRIRGDLLTFYSIGYDIDSPGSDTVHQVEVRIGDDSSFQTRYRKTFVEKSLQSRMQDAVTAGLFFGAGKNDMGLEVAVDALSKATEKQWLQPLRVFLPTSSVAMTRQGDEYVGGVVLFVAMRNIKGNNTDIQRQVHEFRIPVDQYDERKDDRFTVDLRLLLEAGQNTIVIGVLDEKTHQTSFRSLETTSPDLP